MITTVRRIVTKNGQTMAFVGLEDKTGTTELVVFPKVYELNPQMWEADQVIQVSGKISARDRDGRVTSDTKIMVDSAKTIDYDQVKTHKSRRSTPEPTAPSQSNGPTVVEGSLQLRVADLENQQLLIKMRELLSQAPGQSEVYLLAGEQRIRLPYMVAITDGLINVIGHLSGLELVESSPA